MKIVLTLAAVIAVRPLAIISGPFLAKRGGYPVARLATDNPAAASDTIRAFLNARDLG